MAKKEEVVAEAGKLMTQRENIRNIGIVAHIDHGKTTMTDNLIAGAGLISKELAGDQCVTDFYELEQERGITINAACISVVYPYNDVNHLINVIDTPGHVDFGGDVIRAMRAVDGVIVVACAVEGVMPQTETVIRQALRERVKPTLFINKVDRLIGELEVTPEEMQQQFIKIINGVNSLIAKNAPKGKEKEWQVKVEDGSVCFGSAYRNWAVSVPQMKKTGISFKDVYEHVKSDQQKELSEKTPLFIAINDMVVKHLPNPLDAQKYRIKHIWPGDENSELGKAMESCDPNGPLMMMITKIQPDPHAREVAIGRIFSGKIEKGKEVFLLQSKKTGKIQLVGIYMAGDRVTLEDVYAGNIGAIVGLRDAFAGETISELKDADAFEGFMTKTEPVITMAVEATNMKDLPKLIEVIHSITKADPNIRAEINQDTGEHLVSGMGELHLEVTKYRIEHDNGIPVKTSPPIVVYKESVDAVSPEIVGKSPNKHNKFHFTVEPLPEAIAKALAEGEISEGKEKNKDKIQERVNKLVELGMDRDEAKSIWHIYGHNILVDKTKGVQYLFETKELVIQGFEEAMDNGPQAMEKVGGIKVTLRDASLHEDAIHRGPAQTLPAIKRPIWAAILSAKPKLLEPVQKVFISVPQSYLGAVSGELQTRRAGIDDMRTEGDTMIITARAPIKEMIGFAGAIRGATQGRAIWTTEFAGFQPLPRDLYASTIAEIRTRKGRDPQAPSPSFFMDA
ncbi:MAG: elongation factor EF-2 [Candidatus Diapherotrites archaeon]|nr:elongation factor EF-2 [Candidatus Diapherotrites archaeon]